MQSLTGGLAAANLNTWIDYGLAYAKEKYPNLKLVTERIPTDEKQQEAYRKTLDLLRAYPEPQGYHRCEHPCAHRRSSGCRRAGVCRTR